MRSKASGSGSTVEWRTLSSFQKILLRPLPSPERLETSPETLGEITEMGRVSRRIGELAGIERAPSPIRPLVFLVEMDPELLFEQGREAGLLLAEQLRHDLGVLEAGNPNPVVSIEDSDVVVRAVHQHRHRGIAHHLPQRPQIARLDGQRIDHHVMAIGTDLDQTHLVEVGVHRVGLGVESDPTRGSAPLGGLTHTFRGVDPKGIVTRTWVGMVAESSELGIRNSEFLPVAHFGFRISDFSPTLPEP